MSNPKRKSPHDLHPMHPKKPKSTPQNTHTPAPHYLQTQSQTQMQTQTETQKQYPSDEDFRVAWTWGQVDPIGTTRGEIPLTRAEAWRFREWRWSNDSREVMFRRGYGVGEQVVDMEVQSPCGGQVAWWGVS
ncbi:hypothetical protein J1614_003856 [Plenodomus biglobosus]|nr:hypothetical protein J1614_003856 [Plenodomus biglobosus]